MIELKNINMLATNGDVADIAKFVASDYKIRSGLCPNNCGTLSTIESGSMQECAKCGFCTNVLPDGPESLQ